MLPKFSTELKIIPGILNPKAAIARSEDERKIVINEAKAVQGIKEVIPSIFLKEDLANNQRIAN